MKAMGEVTLTLGLMIIVSLFLTSCSGVVTPEISMGNSNNPSSNNPNSNNYQNPSTDPVEESATEESATEESATEESATVEVDTTKPVITGSRDPLPNSLGWNNTDVTVSFSCADTGPVQSGIDINTVAGETLTTEGKDQSVTNTGVCIDVAGNIADPVTVSNIHIDKTPPVVTITLPGTGEYVLNQSVTATWSATDALSGVVSPVSGTVPIDTSSVGTKTFTLPAGTATDKAGNSSLKVTISYSVIEDTEDPETENPQKWSGLTGFCAWHENVETYGDIWLANGFDEWRTLRNYLNTTEVNASKAAVIAGNAKGLKAIWGVSSMGTTITSTNWSDFRAAILDAAQWAQDNGVFEFQIGNEEELWNDGTTMTDAQLIANLKSVATEVKQIFTRGNISYSTSWNYGALVTAGRGDIDLIGLNVYRPKSEENWELLISNALNTFGVDHFYVSEFNVWSDYSEDESIQAVGVTGMIDYIKSLSIERALFYSWHDSPGESFGVVKDDESYRLLWNQALLNSDSVKFATVPTKTTTASLPDAIALIPRITR